MTFGIKNHEPHQGQTLEDVLEHELIKGNKSIQGMEESRSWGHEISWPKSPIGTFREPEYRPHDTHRAARAPDRRLFRVLRLLLAR